MYSSFSTSRAPDLFTISSASAPSAESVDSRTVQEWINNGEWDAYTLSDTDLASQGDVSQPELEITPAAVSARFAFDIAPDGELRPELQIIDEAFGL